MHSRRISRACAALTLVSALFAAHAALAQQRVLLPEGTVLTVTTDQRLNSASMTQGATFTTTVRMTVSYRLTQYDAWVISEWGEDTDPQLLRAELRT